MSNKTRKWRSAIAMVLVISMLFSIFPTAVFADDSAETKTIHYVSFGDSMSNGYGLPGYELNSGVETYGTVAYGNQFAKWLEENGYADDVDHAQLSMSGIRVEDLHWLLELDYNDQEAISLIQELIDGEWDEEKWNAKFTTGDYWTLEEICNHSRLDATYLAIVGGTNYDDASKSFPEKLDPGFVYPTTYDTTANMSYDKNRAMKVALVAKYFQDHAAEADIVSLAVGNGNLGVFAFGRILDAIDFDNDHVVGTGVYRIEAAIRECDPEMQAMILELKDTLYDTVQAEVGMDINSNETLKALADVVVYTGVSMVLNYAGAIEAVLQLNPDAEIMMVPVMNTFGNEQGEIDGVSLGDLMGVIVTPMNAYLAALPTVMQAVDNGVYKDAKFYYAEPEFVECMVEQYDELINDTDSVIRARFVEEIVGTYNSAKDTWSGMIWNLLKDVTFPGGLQLQEISRADVDNYGTDAKLLELAASGQTDKAMSIAVYLAFEDAIIQAGGSTPVDFMSVLGLGEIMGDAGSLFGNVLDGMTTALPSNTASKLPVSAEFVAATVTTTLNDNGLLGTVTKDDVLAVYGATDKNLKAAEIAENLLLGNGSVIEAMAKDAVAKNVWQQGDPSLSGLSGQELDNAWNAAKTDTPDLVESILESNAAVWEHYGTDAISTANNTAKTLIVSGLVEAANSVEMPAMLLAIPGTLSTALQDEDTIKGLLSLFARCMIGNGLGAHPSANGHHALYVAVKDAYANGYTVQDETMENLKVALEATKDFIVEYHPEMIAYAWQVADEEGYTDKAIQALNELDAMLVELASDLDVADAVNGIAPAAELSVDEEAYKEEIAEAIISARAAIAEAIKMLENEDDRTEAQLWAIIEKLEAALSDLYDILVLAAEDGAEYADEVIKEALTELDEVIQQAIADLKELAEEVANGVYDYIVENAPGAIEALKNALYDLAVQTGDDIYWFLYNNPDKVIAFFNEYGDEIWAVVEEYGDEVIGGILYFVADNQEEIGAFLVEYYPEILEFTWTLIEEHGENAAKLINVYAEELGYCDAVRDVIADIEKEIADLKDQLENELKKQLEDLKDQLEDLYKQLENASDEVKAQIQNAIEEVEKLIAEVEKAIAEIEAAIADLEAQLEAAQKALEEAIDAVEAVVEAIKEAIDNGITTVEEILEVIADVVEFAKDTIAGVQTAIDGIVKAVEDVVDFVDELIANGIVAAEMIAEIIDTVMDIIDGVKAELEKGDIEAAIEEIRNQLTNGYEELSAMLAAIDTAIAEQLDAIVGDLEAALAQAQDEFEEALYNATHGELACDAKTIAVYGGETVATEDGYAAIVAEEWGLTQTEAVDMADVILYQVDPQIFVTALLNSVNESTADWTKYISDESVLAYLEQAKAELVDVLAAEYGEEVAAVAEPLADSFLFAVVEYAIANIETIEYLSGINEDALIVAVGMYNPVQGLSVTYGGETIDIDALCQYLIEVTDVYNLLYAIAAQNAVFVDVSEAEAAAFDNVDVDSLLADAMELKAEATVLLREAADTMNEAADALDAGDTSKYNSLLAQYERLMAQAEALYAQVDQIVASVMPMVEALDSSYATADGHAYIAAQILAAIEKADHECEWAIDDNEHCYYCVNCGEEFVCGAHEFDSEEDTVCDVCGYERILIDPTPEITTSSIVVYYLNENNAAIKDTTVREITTTGSYRFNIPDTIVFNGVEYLFNSVHWSTDLADADIDEGNLLVDVYAMPTTGSALEFELRYIVSDPGGQGGPICVRSVAITPDSVSLNVGNTKALTAIITPADAQIASVVWTSDNDAVATVDQNGVVTAVAKGNATITVTVTDVDDCVETATCVVTVTKTSSGGGSFGGGGGYIKPAKPEVIVPDNAVADGVTVTVDYIDYLTVNEVKDLVAKDDNLEVIGGRDSGALVAVKPANAVTSFAHPVQLVVPVSKSALQNVDDVNKLTLALVTTDAQGNIQFTYVGGNYDASKGTFTAYVNQPGKYVLVEKLDLVKIELTIDRYVIFVNGEPIINDVPSRIVNNRTLAPAARVLHHMGCTVEWLSDTRTVAVTLPNGDVLNLPVDEPIPGFGAAPVIENGRTLVPIAYIADMMDAHVQWVGNDRKVIIVK